jgi:hypothetical protein
LNFQVAAGRTTSLCFRFGQVMTLARRCGEQEYGREILLNQTKLRGDKFKKKRAASFGGALKIETNRGRYLSPLSFW